VIERTLSAPLARVYSAGAERAARARWFGGAPGRREVPIHTCHLFTGDRPPVGGAAAIGFEPTGAWRRRCARDGADRSADPRRAARVHVRVWFPLLVACISTKPASSAFTSAGKSAISCTWRISMTSLGPAGQREAHAIASSRDFTWMIQ